MTTRPGSPPRRARKNPPISATTISPSNGWSGGYDLVVIGSHGHRGVRRLLLGSVAEATVRVFQPAATVSVPSVCSVGAGVVSEILD